MPADDDSQYYEDNPMQRAAGLTPYQPVGPMLPTSAQFASAMAASFRAPPMGGGFLGNSFQTPISTFTNGPQYLQGAGGVLMPMNPATYANPAGGFASSYNGPAVPFPNGNLYTPSQAGPAGYRGMTGTPNPLSAMPGAMYDNPFTYGAQQDFASAEIGAAGRASRAGIGARMGMNTVVGGAIAAMGGGAAGFIGGFAGSEMLGLGRGAQNMYMRNFGMRDLNEIGYAAGINQLSRNFISGGADADASGQGFSFSSARRAARAIEGMSLDNGFRRETGNRFNTADVMRITQESTDAGLMQGVQSPEQMQQRVRTVARSLSTFMELANSPDVRQAIQTMGSMHAQGLNLVEVENATRNGRAFARMAGTTFQNLAGVGGSMGAQTFQSMGLSQGLGFQSGMQNMGLAQNTQNLGISSPALMNMVGGSQGLASMNTMFSAGMLRMPMLAPAMMTSGGGLNVGAMQSLMSGGGNPMTMASMGANNLSAMTGRMGVEGLGMALSMQPLLQDTIGRTLQSQGPFAQRNMEDRSMMALMRQMNMRGSSGMITAGRMLGMDSNQALIRAQEMASPEYHSRQRGQIDVRRREQNADIMAERERRSPTWWSEIAGSSDTIASAGRGFDRMRHSIGNWMEDQGSFYNRSYQSQFYSGSARRDASDFYRTRDYRDATRRAEAGSGFAQRGSGDWSTRLGQDIRAMDAAGGAGAASVIGGFFPMGEDARRRNLNAESARANIAQGLLNTNLSDRDQSRLTRSLFGGLDANRNDVAVDIARSLTSQGTGMGRGGRAAINTLWRGGGNILSMGLLDPGNITQQQAFDPRSIQRSYVNRMVSGGMSREEAERNARQNMPAILQAVSRDVRYFSTDEQRQQLERSGALAGHGSENTQTLEQVSRGTLEGSYRRVFGNRLENADTAGGRQQRQAMGEMFDRFDGVGRTSQQRIESRGLMAAATSLRAVMTGQTNASANQKAEAQTKLRELFDQMRRRGFRTEDINQMMRQTENVQLNDNQRRMADTVAGQSTTDMVTNMTNAARERVIGEGQRLSGQGASRFANAGGELNRIFQVQDGSSRRQATSEEIMTSLRNVGDDRSRLSALRNQNSAMADLARRAAQGEDVRDAVNTLMRGAGESSDRAAREYDERESNRSAPMRFLRGIGEKLGVVQDRESAINEAVSQGTSADQSALNQTTNSSMLEEAARRMGIGGSNDQLLRASQSLERAAQMLSGVAESGQIQRLTAADSAGV